MREIGVLLIMVIFVISSTKKLETRILEGIDQPSMNLIKTEFYP